MQIRTTGLKSLALALAMVAPIGATGIASAQSGTVHHGWLHRHHNLASAGVGVGAYEAAKHSHRHNGHANWMQRHPVLTGMGAAAIAHHHFKKH